MVVDGGGWAASDFDADFLRYDALSSAHWPGRSCGHPQSGSDFAVDAIWDDLCTSGKPGRYTKSSSANVETLPDATNNKTATLHGIYNPGGAAIAWLYKEEGKARLSFAVTQAALSRLGVA